MASRYQTVVRDVPYALAAVGLLGIVVLISAAIVSRNLGIRIGGLQTGAQLLGVWLAFVVAGGLAHQRRHIEIDYFADKLPERLQRYHGVVVILLNLVVCFILFVGGLIAMNRFWESTAPNAPIPIPVYYAAITIGGLLLTVVYGRQLLPALRSRQDGRDLDRLVDEEE